MGKVKLGLGKGLDALIDSSSEEIHKNDLPQGITLEADGSLTLDIDRLSPNPHQPRLEFEESTLQELADSIREHGIIQPVTVESADEGKYYIIAGERRTRAAKLAGLTKIPILLKHYSEERKLEVALIENIQRENLNPIEEALAYSKLMQMSQISQEELSHRVGKNRSTIANALRLLKLPEDMQTALVSGKITAGHARAILSISDSTDQRILFGKITGTGLSVREAESYAAELNTRGKIPTTSLKSSHKEITKDPDLSFIEQQFIDTLGTKVAIKGSIEKGSVTIDYFSKDDLDRLYSLIVDKDI